MRKFNKFRSHALAAPVESRQRWMRSRTFRSLLLAVAGVLLLMAALAPRANAALIAYYNFEGDPTAPYPANLESHPPAFFMAGNELILTDENGDPYDPANTFAADGIPLNVAAGDPDPNLTALGFRRTMQHDLNVDIPLISGLGIFDVMSVSFAYGSNGNGYEFVQLQFSSDGGLTFTDIGGIVELPSTPGAVIMITVPDGTTLDIPDLVMRLQFTGGQSNGNDEQFELDNIQINGVIIPEPATVAGGLLGVLGLCWFQRKRLLRSVRLRRT
jgi:hypothetical protein